ncbi:hypothetical protein [Sulfurimonas sp.]
MIKKILLSLVVMLGLSTALSAGVNDKTVVKNSNIKTEVKSGNVDVKGKLNMGSVKVGKGTEIEGSNIESRTSTGNVNVGQGGEADIGGVSIGN